MAVSSVDNTQRLLRTVAQKNYQGKSIGTEKETLANDIASLARAKKTLDPRQTELVRQLDAQMVRCQEIQKVVTECYQKQLAALLSQVKFKFDHEWDALSQHLEKTISEKRITAEGHDHAFCDPQFFDRYFMVNLHGEIAIIFADKANRKGKEGKYSCAYLGIDLAHPKLIIGKVFKEFSKSPPKIDELRVFQKLKGNRHVLQLKASSCVIRQELFSYRPCYQYNYLFTLPWMNMGDYRQYQKLKLGFSYAQLYDILAGMNKMHKAGIIHRDLKPGNILCTRGSNRLKCKLADFNLSISFPVQGEIKTGGTPVYQAPEIIATFINKKQSYKEKMTPKVDVWAIGVTVYDIIFDQMPFLHEQTESKAAKNPKKHYYKQLLMLEPDWYEERIQRQLPEHPIDPELIKMLKGMLQLKPEQRPSSEGLLNLFWKLPAVAHLKDHPDREIELSKIWIKPPQK